MFLATWKDIPNENELQYQIKECHLNAGKYFVRSLQLNLQFLSVVVHFIITHLHLNSSFVGLSFKITRTGETAHVGAVVCLQFWFVFKSFPTSGNII